MAVYQIDPLKDARWEEFLLRDSRASAFHSTDWLRTLNRAYGYEPVVFTTSAPGRELTNGIPFCYVRSWLTGRRLVSLPFSDHCEPLADSPGMLNEILTTLVMEQGGRLKYVELRPLSTDLSRETGTTRFGRGDVYTMHMLDLRPTEEDLFRGFHKSCTQRPIKKAEREGLTFEEGRSEDVLRKYYHLLLLTRRRHQLPPQPIEWYRNVVECMGEKAKIWVALKDGVPVASILTLFYKQTLMYKYGCSDSEHFNLGGTFALFWRAIREAKAQGATLFDLGKSDIDNEGLVTFKDRWGAERTDMIYYRYPAPDPAHAAESWKHRLAKTAFSILPDPILAFAGRALYRHQG